MLIYMSGHFQRTKTLKYSTMKLFLFLSLFVLTCAERRRFDGCEVWEVTPSSEDGLRQLHALSLHHRHESEDELIFWEEPRRVNEEVNVLACTLGKMLLQNFLARHQVSAKKLDIDFQKGLDAQWARSDAKHSGSNTDWDENDYNSYEDIMAYLDVLQENCPSGVTCTVEEVGSSYEGRPMRMFRMTKEGSDRLGIFMDSMLHAREWLAGATNMGILSRLVNEYETNEDARRLVDTYDWHFLPAANPDGYSYTWTNDRFWRKNRTPNQGQSCLGTDLNRNHNFMWGTPGSDTWPCSSTYRGATSGSEPEIQVIEKEGEALRGTLLLWLTWHTTGMYYLYPYGTVDTNLNCMVAPDDADLKQVGEATIKAVQETYNEGQWVAGSTCDALYRASAITQDWAYGTGLVKYSYTPELRGPGFNPSPSAIRPSIEENWNGLLAMLNEIETIEGL